MSETIEVEATTQPQPETVRGQTMAIDRRSEPGVGRAMTVDELHKQLDFIRQVMRKEMKEGTDYGKIPGTGEKPTLLQPGAQKLLMTFNLTEEVKKEVLREFPSMPMHREYEFTITVCASNGKRWDGVGTCSTLETKYRYRRAERKCPNCGKNAVIAEKPEYLNPGEVPGWICWKKKNGCGTRYRKDHPQIDQDAAPTENPDPADCWNTVRKMAFKRALVAAAINATNTSELWTQDLEDGSAGEDAPPKAKGTQKAPQTQKGATNTPPAAQTPATGQPASKAPPQKPPDQEQRYATDTTRAWMIRNLGGGEVGALDVATDYFRKIDNALMPNETLEHLPLEWVPLTRDQLAKLNKAISDFANGNPAVKPYEPNPIKEEEKKRRAAVAAAVKPKAPPQVETAKAKDPEWFFEVICPIPNKGQKRADYMKKPDTIRSLYFAQKAGDEGAGKRLWGFANHYQPEAREHNGKIYQPSEADKVFRQALDAFLEWEQKHGNDTGPDHPANRPFVTDGSPEADREADLAAKAQDDVPF